MKERQDSIAARIAGTIAGGVRRRQQDRTPRALVYDEGGEPRIVRAGSDEQARLIEAAEVLVGIAIDDPAGAGEAESAAPDDGGDAQLDPGGAEGGATGEDPAAE